MNELPPPVSGTKANIYTYCRLSGRPYNEHIAARPEPARDPRWPAQPPLRGPNGGYVQL